ncbi:MAG: hypothetical protein M9932_01565 [Xanthobacteraceae bacterium]|nr:hypothetical protein [Xanthobacteraceae bacterium]
MAKRPPSPSRIHFDGIVALMATGMTMRAACASDPRFPTDLKFASFCAHSPEHRERLREAKAASGVRNGPAIVKRHLDLIKRLRGEGATWKAIAAALPEKPSAAVVKNACGYYPEIQAEVMAARRATGMNRPGRAAILRYWDEILKLIEGGMLYREALESDPKFPSYEPFRAIINEDPERRRQYQEATLRREANPATKRGKACEWTDTDLIEFASRVADIGAVDRLYDAIVVEAPALSTFRRRALDNPKLRQRLDQVLTKRNIRLGMERSVSNAERKLVEAGRRETRLNQNELYRLARRAVPGWLDSDDREDVVSDVVITLIERGDDVIISDIGAMKKLAAKLAGNYVRRTGRNHLSRDKSLDQNVFDDGRTTVGDTVTVDMIEW